MSLWQCPDALPEEKASMQHPLKPNKDVDYIGYEDMITSFPLIVASSEYSPKCDMAELGKLYFSAQQR